MLDYHIGLRAIYLDTNSSNGVEKFVHDSDFSTLPMSNLATSKQNHPIITTVGTKLLPNKIKAM